MALFKIFKGNNTERLTNPSTTAIGGYIQPVDGYAYYDTSSRLFYIDTVYDGVLKRAPINANLAWSAAYDGASAPQKIDTTYIKDLRYATATHALMAKRGNGVEDIMVTLPISSYTSGQGISITNGSINNAGVIAIGTGASNGSLSVNTNGVTSNVYVKGLGDLAYISKPTSLQASSFLRGDGTWQTASVVDTQDTAGAANTSQKIYLVGSTTQATVALTYTQDTAYVGTDGCLYSNNKKVLTDHQDISGKLDKTLGVTNISWDSTNKKITKTINETASDVVTVSTLKTAMSLNNVANINQSKAIKSIIRSGTTFTYTCLDSTTGSFDQQDTNTTYSFIDGDNGTFVVVPSGGTAQTVNIGKPASASAADSVPWTGITGKPSSYTPASHYHGNIQNNGSLQTNDVTIENNDKLVITDSGNNGAIARSSIAFDGSTTNKALTPKGTWETFLQNHQSLEAYATKASPIFTGTPLAPTPTNSSTGTQIATVDYVKNSFAVNDAMIFKGTIGTGGTVNALPTTHNAGWTYKVITATTYAGQACEIGDMIICVEDGSTNANAHWTVVQTNIDGNVISTGTSTSGNVAIFTGNAAKVIGDSGFYIKSSVPANAKFTDTTYTLSGTASGNTWKTTLTPSSGSVTESIVPAMTGANSTSAGKAGLVPAPAANEQDKFLSGAGSWVSITKSSLGLGNVQNVDTTNASNITSGTLPLARLPSATAVATGTYGTDTNINLTHDGSFMIPSLTVDSYGRITQIKSTTVKLPPNENTDRYVNSISFSNNSIMTSAPLKITLTRAGSDSQQIEGNIPAVSPTSPGVVPMGASVTTQTQATKFLREDGTWAAPSYPQAMAPLTFGANNAFVYDGTTAVTVPLYTGTGIWV